MITCYQDLLDTALGSDEPQRLLIVLLRAESMHQGSADGVSEILAGEGTLTPAMARDFPLDDGLTLQALVADADLAAPGWQFMVTAVLAGRHGHRPSSDDAAPYLKRMANAVMTGERLEAYAVFDREGEAVRLEAVHA